MHGDPATDGPVSLGTNVPCVMDPTQRPHVQEGYQGKGKEWRVEAIGSCLPGPLVLQKGSNLIKVPVLENWL